MKRLKLCGLGSADEDEKGKVQASHVDVTYSFCGEGSKKGACKRLSSSRKWLVLPQPQGCPVRQRVVKGHGWFFMAVLQVCTAPVGRSITNR